MNKTTGESTNLTAPLVMKVIQVTLGKDVGTGISIESEAILATHVKKGKIDLGWIENKIAEGGAGQIYSIADREDVYKKPQKTMTSQQLINESFLNEVKIVNKLNENGPHDGISLSLHLIEPMTLSGLKTGKGRPMRGILMPRYDNDYFLNIPKEEAPLTAINKEELFKIATEFEKLLSGLAYMHSLDILHGDIKPQNILQKGDRTDFIDFGTARDVQEGQNPVMKVATPFYCHVNDLTAQDEVKRDKLCDLEKARDVFALGTTFHLRFHHSSPIEGDNRNPLPEFVPLELSQLIEQMTDPNWENRLTAADALAQIKVYKESLL